MNPTEQFQILLDSIPDYAIFLLDPEGRISTWSSAAEKMFGYSATDIQEHHFSCLYPEADAQNEQPHHALRLAASHGRFEDTHWGVRRDGTRFWADSVICPLRNEDGTLRGFSQVIQDITERRKSEELLRQKEEELSQARKLEAIGRLAGGVAHDFNNFITGIMGLSDEIRLSFDEQDPRRQDMEEIIKTADRARILTRQLLTFGSRQISSPQVLSLNGVLSEQHKTLSRLLGAAIRIETDLDPAIGAILIDPTQLDQILVNLIMNARDAMPQGGRILMKTARFYADKETLSNTPPGPYVSLTISDTGFGIEPHILPHLFEPFFTTKQKGKGTGLGLATVYGIVKQIHGDISVQSRPGEGTSFRLLFPEIDAPVKTDSKPLRPIAYVSGSETILVVDDEEVVRRVAVIALKKRGYRVIPAATGAEALDGARLYTDPIHLLLTDIVMPGMNGTQLAVDFCALHPETTVLYMSAFAEDSIQARGRIKNGLFFIEKPFTGDLLALKVQDVLQNRARMAASSGMRHDA